LIASLPKAERDAFLAALSEDAVRATPWLFEVWARAETQLPPEGDWRTWLMLGGRGSGKTRAGAEWVRRAVEGATPREPGSARRVALVAETWQQARDVMVQGPSGLLACSPPDRRPLWRPSLRKLIWVNGAEAALYSAADPESLRGPQFDLAWCDELGKWRRAQDAWDMLQFGLRLGERPRQAVTTTPRDTPLLRALLEDPATATTRAPTAENAAFLAPGFVAQMRRHYGDTALGRQELDGVLIGDPPGALFRRADIERARVAAPPDLDRIVVAVDPPASSHAGSDACGIVVAGRAGDAVYVLEDASVGAAAPAVWAARAIEAAHRWGADRIVAEANQGGDMVMDTLRHADRHAPVAKVHARLGKRGRAEPVSMLYARGLVRHAGVFPALEDELCGFERGRASPDRMDALVWAVATLVEPAAAGGRISTL